MVTVTSSGCVRYLSSRPHITGTIETPLCLHSRHLTTPLLLSLCIFKLSRQIHPPLAACLCHSTCSVWVFVSAHLFACAISLRVRMSAPEIPAPPRWAWSPGPARRTKRLLSKHRAYSPPRTRSSISTNCAWTLSGVKSRPSDRGVATQTSTAPGETLDSQRVNTVILMLSDSEWTEMKVYVWE